MKTPRSALRPAHSYKSSVWAQYGFCSLAITERKDKKEIYLAETKGTIYNTKIILKNAYLLNLIQAFIHVQTAGGDEAFKNQYNLNDHFHPGGLYVSLGFSP